MSVVLVACGGGSGGSDDAGRDAEADDAPVADAATDDATIDASESDARLDSGVERDAELDSGVERVDGPSGSEPPDVGLEPGSDADHLYRYCWLLAETFCRGNHACCDLPERVLSDDVEECHDNMVRSLCDVWPDRPDAVGPQDVEELEFNLERLDAAADVCGDLAVKFVFAFGVLEPGADCSSEGFNPSFLCGEDARCVDDVCTASPGVGEACLPASIPNRCAVGEAFCNEDGADAVCVAHEDRPVGESCEQWGECETYRCEEGMCVEPEESPWCFMRR